MGVTIDDARAVVAELPRSSEDEVRGEVRFRVCVPKRVAADYDRSIGLGERTDGLSQPDPSGSR